MGSALAVHEITMSNSARRPGRSARRIASAPKRPAIFSPRSSVRFATAIMRGLRAAKCVATSSTISPAPTNSTRVSRRSSKSCDASRAAAAAMLIECAPISVEVRTSLATANDRWNIWCSEPPRVPAVSASRTACFIWPRICGSPSTIESRPLATRKAWRAAEPPSSTYEWARKVCDGTPPTPASQSTAGVTAPPSAPT